MKIEELRVKYPSGFEHALHMTKEKMEQHLRLMAALKMFELGKISSGKAAELAGMSRFEFLEKGVKTNSEHRTLNLEHISKRVYAFIRNGDL